MVTNGKITISKRYSLHGELEGTGGEWVVIEIKDDSGATVSAEMNLRDYASAILGLARVECSVSATKLEHWGKTPVVERRRVTIDNIPGASNADYEVWLLENKQEDGYELLTALRSRGSVIYTDNNVTLTYSVRKYV